MESAVGLRSAPAAGARAGAGGGERGAYYGGAPYAHRVPLDQLTAVASAALTPDVVGAVLATLIRLGQDDVAAVTVEAVRLADGKVVVRPSMRLVETRYPRAA